MKKNKKVVLYIFSGIAVLVILLIAINNFAEYKIKTAIEKNLKEENLSYKEVNVSLLGRRASISEAKLDLPNKKISAGMLALDDIGIWDYLVNNKIIIGELRLKDAVFVVTGSKKKDSAQAGSGKKFNKQIVINKLKLQNAKFAIQKEDSSANKLFARIPNLELTEIEADSSTVKKAIPFTYRSYSFRSDSLFLQMNPQHHILVSSISDNNGRTSVKDFRIVPLYGKQEFQQQISKEKDRVELKIDSIGLKDLSWKVENDSLQLSNPFTSIANAKLQLYRDKTLPDDESRKLMYSEVLRELPVKVKFDTLRLNNVYIRYEELHKQERGPGVVDFANLNASIYNLTNIGLGRKDFPRTDVDIRADFMGEAALKVNWNFDVSSRAENFTISGNLAAITADPINEFLTPGMGVEAKGTIEDMQFDFEGNQNTAQGEMRLKYHNFKVQVLKKNSSKTNELMSALANLIVDNNSRNEEAYYENLSVQRDKTKSFWNYFWKCIRSGALKAFIKF